MTSLLAFLADITLGPRCTVCGDRYRGWRTLLAHTYIDHPGEA